ncbi:hypothetical protein PMAYCL1PPCAC_23827, partial [Pristionchus mayeri]
FRMFITSWGLTSFLLLLHSTIVGSTREFSNKCASKGTPSTLPHGIKIALPYKVSAIFTDWKANTTSLIEEMWHDSSYVIETSTRSAFVKWSTIGKQLLRSNETDCAVETEVKLFPLPSDISNTLLLNVSSLSGIVNSIVDRNITGYSGDYGVDSGVNRTEWKEWIGCLNVNSTSSVIAVEVVYIDDSLNLTSTSKNLSVLSIVISVYENADIDSNMSYRISFDFSPIRQPNDLHSHLEINHGIICGGLSSENISIEFPEVFEAIYSRQWLNSSVSGKVAYYHGEMIAESVIDGRAHLLNETFSNDVYLVVYHLLQGKEFVFSSSNACEMKDSGAKVSALDLFVPHNLTFTLYANFTRQKISTVEYRAPWGKDNVVEMVLHDSNLSMVSIYSKGTLESVSSFTVKDSRSGDAVDIGSLLRSCFCRYSSDHVSFLLKGVSMDKLMMWRDLKQVDEKIAARLISLQNGTTISPYRLSFLYIGDSEGGVVKDNTRVILAVADELQAPTEMTSSAFLTLLNTSLAHGISFQISDNEIWEAAKEPLTTYPSVVPSFSGYTGGSMLVLALFMVMLGAIVGSGGVYVVLRRQRISTLAYQVFE